MNIKALAENLGLDETEFLELVMLFAETGQVDLARLEAALAIGDTDQVMRSAHTIKGASGNLGLIEFSALALAIEKHATNQRLEAAARVCEDLRSRFAALQADL